MGYIINRLGVVQVIQLDPKVVGVRVVRSYAPFSPGDPVMRFTPPSTEDVVDSAASGGDVEAMVIELQADKNMSLVSQGNVVYLDKGQEDGLHAGDFLEVFRTGGGLPERKIGTVKVLSAEPRTAAAVLSKATARVLIGDRLRTKHASLIEAMPSEGGGSIPPAIVQPAMTGSEGTVSSPATTPYPFSNARIERTRGITTINLDDLADQLEYESGEAKVKPAGVPILQQLTEYLKATALHQQVRVEGHSDNMEIGPTLKGQFPTNWELSKARAVDIVRYLIEKGGMDSAKLSAVGYGASRPVASNATEEGRKKNRRIEVILESPDNGPTEQPVKASAREEQPKPPQVSLNEMGVASPDTAGTVSAPAIPVGPSSIDAPSPHGAPPSDTAEPAAPAGAELGSAPPGL